MKVRMGAKRIIAACLCSALCFVDASAAMKEVYLWGAKSINDMGSSDRRISMEELQEDYSGYLQTDGMTEYFHKDQPVSPKLDMNEALAWLIDNGVINRDETITVSNITGVPAVSIVKSDINSKLFYNVNRSDALMYIYKVVFGPITGRTVGVETPSVRSDNGSLSLFTDIAAKHNSGTSTTGSWNTTGGLPGTSGTGFGGTGGPGGDAVSGNGTTTGPIGWVYTPQGDAYTSVFGDTNVFITENTFNQEATGGDGGNGGIGVNGGSMNTGSGGDGGGGGGASNTINYETDYKRIYFVPGSDILFYRTDDVVEAYLQALLSKGLLEFDSALRTDKFHDEFTQYTVSGAPIAPWSGAADAYVVNLSKGKHVRVENVAYTSTEKVLGVNYSVRTSDSSMSISRHNLFESNTGYFVTEEVNKMDLYRYVYYMVYANEKKMSDLERDLVNYKYGMEFSGIANEEDTEILKYLIAKGILDFNGSSELSNLYGSVSWYDFIPVLYRVANKNARLDFTAIQLTDSEQSWKAKGFSPQTVYIVDSGSIGELSVTLDPGYEIESAGVQDTSPVSMLASILGITEVEAAPAEIGTVSYRVENSGAMTFNGYYFDFAGAIYDDDELMSQFRYLLSEIDSSSSADLLEQTSDGYNKDNPKHRLVGEILKNIYVISRIQTTGSLYTSMSDWLTEWTATQPASMSDETYKLKVMVAGYLQNMLEAARTGSGAPTNIKFVMTDGTVTNVPNVGDGGLLFARNLKTIRFDFPATGGLSRATYSYEFQEKSAGALIADGVSVVDAVNKSAVEFKKRFTEAEVQAAGGTGALQDDLSKQIGTVSLSLYDNNSDSAFFVQQVDPTGKDAFVSWADVESAMAKVTDVSIPIVKVSDSLLYNTQTDTYAYFSDSTSGSAAVALVGTAVVTGDSDLGVMFKSGDGESAVMYYHVNAIRLLLNARQEDAVIGGIRGISMPSDNFAGAVTSVDLISESGVAESKVAGLQCLISSDYAADSQLFGPNTAFAESKRVGNSVWGNYVSLSQANRVMNIISRRIRYSSSSSGKSDQTAFAVVMFVPVDAEELGTVSVDRNTSLQDLLDSPAQAPTDPVAKQVWTSNKAACNAYANWIYGTSNITYIETGYVRPVAALYILGDSAAMPPASIFTPLSDSQRAAVSVIPMGKVTLGAVARLSSKVTEATSSRSWTRSSYWLAEDCSAIVCGDRIYLHDSLFVNMELTTSNGVTYARVANQTVRQAVFTPGATFKVDGVANMLGNGMKQPNIMVVETTSDGMVRCQVGPITGMPVSLGVTKAVVYAAGNVDGVSELSTYDLTSATGDNRIITTFAEMFKAMPGVKSLGISSDPIFMSTGLSGYYVFNGSSLNIYERGTKPVASVAVPSASSSDTLASYSTSLSNAVSSYSSVHPNLTRTYIDIEFPASNFRVRDGKLQYQKSSAAEFLSPSLFSSLNDLIIDDIINASNGAIPVNEIPDGALLKIGNCYYQAVGSSSDNKSFVGYAYLNSSVTTATLQDAAPSFASQLVRAGNQYMNVSHWFTDGTAVLGNTDGTTLNALQNVANQTLKIDPTFKRSVDSNGNIEVIVSSGNTTSSSLYCPIRLVLSDGLYAYKVSSLNSSDSPRYSLCASADSSISGAFADLPFFTNRVFDAELYDQTTDLLSATFVKYEGASGLMDLLREQFQQAFAGDLITLARMIIFIILCWLVVASWLCFVCRLGNIMPILEAIRYPSRDRSNKGIDLFRVVSLGTINLDMEFGLGRFLQYEAILACLLCIVMLTGNITL